MKNNWEIKKFSYLCDIHRGSSPRPIHEWISHNGIPWIKIADATKTNSRFVSTTREYIKYSEKFKGVRVYPGDLVLTNSATPGIPKIINLEGCIHDGWLLFRNFNNIDKIFAYYLLINERPKIIQKGSGTIFTNLKIDILKNHVIEIPPLNEQRAIAGVLSSLDDKIDLLHRQNETLEALAETLFRQWFIEEAQDDWEEKPLDEISDYLNGMACQKYPPKNEMDRLPVLKIKELRGGISDKSDWASTDISDEYIVHNGDVVFSWSGSLLVKIWDGELSILNQHLFKVTSLSYPKWFYYLWTQHYLRKFISIAQSKTTTMGHIKRGDLANSMVLIPIPKYLNSMNEIFAPLITKMIFNNQQIITLEKLRNTLLPKLMSGEVRVL